MATEYILFRPVGLIGKNLTDLVRSSKLEVTTIFTEDDPILFVPGEVFPYKGSNRIKQYLQSHAGK
jgi:hypothetical protein